MAARPSKVFGALGDGISLGFLFPLLKASLEFNDHFCPWLPFGSPPVFLGIRVVPLARDGLFRMRLHHLLPFLETPKRFPFDRNVWAIS